MAHLLYPDCLKEEQTTLTKHKHPDGFHKYVRSTTHPDNQHEPPGYKSSEWSNKVKRVLHAITTSSHGPHLVTCRVRRQEEATASHFPRSFYMITSYDLWQQYHLPRFLTAASRVAMTMLPPNVIITNIKYLLAINERNSTPEAVYICLRTKKKGIPLVTS